MNDSLVIIPTYNEKENIEALLNAVLNTADYLEILVVDDSSPDGTGDIVEQISQQEDRIHLIRRSGKQGLGTAYLTGFEHALKSGYEFIFEMDADFSHSPSDLLALRSACVEGADVAIGSRYVNGVNVVNWPLGRVLLSYLASIYVRFVTGLPINDATAGFKCYKRRVLETLRLDQIKFVGYAFQIEMKFKAWKHGFNLTEVPIIFINRSKGESKMSTGIFKEAFFGVIQLKLQSLFQKYPSAKSN